MESNTVINRIKEGTKAFQNQTMFLANWVKINLQTREMIAKNINLDGVLENTGLFVLIDNNISDGEAFIGMGQGPHTTKVIF